MLEEQRFRDELKKQLRFIERSCETYDQGHFDEAIRIALHIRVILHPGGSKSRSLLQHMNRGRIPLLTTSEGAPERPDLIGYIGMGSFSFSSDGQSITGGYHAGFDRASHREYIKADKWWKQVVLFTNGIRYSRENIALDVAQQDGGAHVAASFTPKYERLKTPGVVGHWVEISGSVKTSTPIPNAHFTCVRQMAYELLKSPELLQLAGYTPTLSPDNETRVETTSVEEHAQDENDGESDGQSESEAEAGAYPESRNRKTNYPIVTLTNKDVQRIYSEVVRYYKTYCAELRSAIEANEASHIPNYFCNYRHILLQFSNDGVVVTHYPHDGDEDIFGFKIAEDMQAKDIVAAQSLETPNGTTKNVHLDYEFGQDFGQNGYLGPLVHREGETYYRTAWIQMDWASWTHSDIWSNESEARARAKAVFERLQAVPKG